MLGKKGITISKGISDVYQKEIFEAQEENWLFPSIPSILGHLKIYLFLLKDPESSLKCKLIHQGIGMNVAIPVLLGRHPMEG